ncbi:hypothetical protein DOK76_03705 [Vagococcus sp. DIV0080]|uniref:Excisionase n=1 Tax=Candidatus Vagococcus giribetii TaxID=2230876 RepID=A0ABS3HQY7_9ENTE|nr:hypothetical protein [Vagococcus sp. DIV0080]MBO0476161.1 hypothetical protein [Vagococcus sp. DIV0080]
MSLNISEMLEKIATDPDMEDIIYANKSVICKKFSMKLPTLDKWIKEIHNDFPVKHTVINPGGLCLINIKKFEEFLIWKSDKKFRK